MPHSMSHDHVAFRQQMGRRLRELRVHLHLSQQELAARAGVSRNFVGGVERGVQSLDAWRLQLLSRALRVPPGTLLEPSVEAGGVQPDGLLPGVPR